MRLPTLCPQTIQQCFFGIFHMLRAASAGLVHGIRASLQPALQRFCRYNPAHSLMVVCRRDGNASRTVSPGRCSAARYAAEENDQSKLTLKFRLQAGPPQEPYSQPWPAQRRGQTPFWHGLLG